MKINKLQFCEIVIEILKGGLSDRRIIIEQFSELTQAVEAVLVKRNAPAGEGKMSYGLYPYLSPEDEMILLEIFWDLFREGIITLGFDSSKKDFPWFRVHSGAKF